MEKVQRRTWLKTSIIIMTIMVVIAGSVWIFGPREPASLALSQHHLDENIDIDEYLSAANARYDDIITGVEKQVIWAGKQGQKTPLSLIYLHGFSASAMELRPVPDNIAAALGANLYFTRLTGHGRGPHAMTDATIAKWMGDLSEALAIGRRIGQQTIIIATSTGGTLAAAAALDPASMQGVGGIVFVSPNFAINNAAAGLLTWPFARHWVPLIVGPQQENTPRNALHGKYWATSYPTTALMPMAALVEAVAAQDFSKVETPALFYYSPDDQVVVAQKTAAIAQNWGGPVQVKTPRMSADDDPFSHLIAGDIVSPGQTDPAVAAMVAWIKSNVAQ